MVGRGGSQLPPDAALKWSEDGAGLDYNRPPRLRPAERKTRRCSAGQRVPVRPDDDGDAAQTGLGVVLCTSRVTALIGWESVHSRWGEP
ncbi:hypothetical protein B9W62_07200 [Streptomyces sp. CS113]|nr:hypothetical protein B9W62_07200 [Streptomyces sp. CS113]